MAKGFFRELKHYTIYRISKELDTSIEETKRLVGILKKYGVVKAVKKSKPEYEDLSNEDIVLTSVTENTLDIEYVFAFVGIIMLEGNVFKCYPKYILSTKEPMKQLKMILKVIKKYNSKEQLIYLYNGEEGDKNFNKLAIYIYMLEDYFQYGLYTNQHETIEINGEGEILWDRTINETFALIQNNCPYYIELQTQNIVNSDYDYFRRLHKCILSACSKELNKVGILELFDVAEVELTDAVLEDLGNKDYILERLQKEIQAQFVTRKQNLLKTLYTYVANYDSNDSKESLSLYGTNSFNLVWEKICAKNFGSVLDKELKDLPLGISEEYYSRREEKLINIIPRPIWHKNAPNIYDDKTKTLKPDLICIYPCNDSGDYCFGIYDAKYYCIDFKEQESGWKVTGQPGVGDVTKQYLYQLAYDDFVVKQGYKYIQNIFLCPQEEKDIEYGYVEMKMLHTIGERMLENILVVKLCAEEMYKLFLSNKVLKDKDITHYIPQASKRNVANQNYSNRMMAYLQGIAGYSQVSAEKMKIPSIRGKLIYPEKIKREVGIKLIYDAMCPIACGIFYGFDPYEKEYRNIVAEDLGDSYSKVNLIADVAFEIENYIKRLPEQELCDASIIKIVLKQCFQGKDEIFPMVDGHNLDKLVANVMELIREVYL